MMIEKFNKKVIREIINLLRKLEEDRSVLIQRCDFTIQRAFELFSENSLDRLSASDLVAKLNHQGIICQTQDAELIIRRYDADFDGRLSFWEFGNIF